LFGGGGGGIGGPGGWGTGTGAGTGPADHSGAPPTDKDASPRDKTKPEVPKDQEKPLQRDTVLQLEVLTDPEVEKEVGKKGVAEQRFFRLKGDDPAHLLTLDELKDVIRKRMKDQ